MVDESTDKLFKDAIEKANAKQQEQDGEELKVRDKVIKKYGKIFNPDNIDNLTKAYFAHFAQNASFAQKCTFNGIVWKYQLNGYVYKDPRKGCEKCFCAKRWISSKNLIPIKYCIFAQKYVI